MQKITCIYIWILCGVTCFSFCKYIYCSEEEENDDDDNETAEEKRKKIDMRIKNYYESKIMNS